MWRRARWAGRVGIGPVGKDIRIFHDEGRVLKDWQKKMTPVVLGDLVRIETDVHATT